jgi:hypothetical protein
MMFGRTLFSVGDQIFQTDDLVSAAILSGRWNVLRREARAGLDAEAELGTADDHRLEEAVETTAAEFRYARDLITAEDAERWLEERDVEVDEWLGSIRRRLLAPAGRKRMPLAAPPDPPELTRAVWVSFICDGAAADLAAELARQAAAHAMAGQQVPPPVDDEAMLEQDRDTILSYFPGLDLERIGELVRRLGHLASAVGRCRRLVLTPEAVRREVEHRALDLLRLNCHLARFESELLAREAALCVKDDGLSLADAAGEARTQVEDLQLYVEDAQAELRDLLRSAAPQALLGPVAWEGRCALVQVLEKVRPSPEDDEVRHRAEAHLLDRLFEDFAEHQVTWSLRF